MNEINRAAYITALQGLLVAATDAQLDTIWCMATKMILEQEECEKQKWIHVSLFGSGIVCN